MCTATHNQQCHPKFQQAVSNRSFSVSDYKSTETQLVKTIITFGKLSIDFSSGLTANPSPGNKELFSLQDTLSVIKSNPQQSYISAIRAVLQDNNIKLNEDQYLINSLTKACKLVNDRVRTRLVIQKAMLEVLLGTTSLYFDRQGQVYLQKLYTCIFSTIYFGLFRIGELTSSPHVVKAKDVQIAKNKEKILFILRSLKTHTLGSKPQKIKITTNRKRGGIKPPMKTGSGKKLPCPYQVIRHFLAVRPHVKSTYEQFFVFVDNSPVKPNHVRQCLKRILRISGFNAKSYTVHSLRAGRALDLLQLGLSIENIKKVGRWRSNAIYEYLK